MKQAIIIFFIIGAYFSLLVFSLISKEDQKDPLITTDVSGLMPIKVLKVVEGKEDETLVNIVKKAKIDNLKISIAGTKHSMGGHTYYKDAIVLDMTSYNKILEFDPVEKTIIVQSGATWDDIQRYVNPYGLAVKVMQSQNIFTIGGSLSANAHGRDIRYGSLIDTVRSFRLLNANGEIVNVSREENKDLFSLVIGGYGLFGVILDVELELTEDELYTFETVSMDYSQYTDYFEANVLKNPKVRMHLARISTAPDYFLTSMYVTNYVLPINQSSNPLKDFNTLKEDRFTWLTKFSLGLSRDFDWGKNLFWNMQQSYFLKKNGTFVTRNNVMRSESKFLEYENESDTDVLQEYFVPVTNFTAYIDDLRSVLSKEELNLINITIRYVQEDEDAVLSYAKEDMFALVLLINEGLSKEDQENLKNVIRKMVDVTLLHNGSYYLPYMPFPTREQMRESYPRTEEFFKKKKQYDPKERFMNYFYEEYK